TTSTSVTAPMGAIAASGSHVLTYSATVGAVSSGTIVTSSGVVTFSPATTGTSPTAADATSLTVGSANTQDWTVTLTQAPPANAHVGDTITVKAKIAVGAGPDDLQVTGVSSGAGSNGFDQVSFSGSPPYTVAAGASKTVTATARVTAAPGTGAVHLQVSVDGALGAASTSTKSVDTSDVAVVDAVTATLSGGPATVVVSDQITYTLTLTNASDTAVQLSDLPAGLVAPTGTTQANRTDGTSTIAAHDSTAWTLVVDVDDADADQSVITQTPSAKYAMSAVGLGAESVPITPTSVSSTVSNDTTKPDVAIEQAGGQTDPTSSSPISFTATFSEPVTGFTAGDIDVSASVAGGTLTTVVSGGPSVYTVDVSGMTTDGTVIATIPAGVVQDGSANTNTASTSTDNVVTWQQKIPSTTGVALTPTASVYGQTVTATATVGVTSGTADGAVQFAVDGTDVGTPVTVIAGTALSPALTGSGGIPLPVGSRHVTATFAPTDPTTYAGSTNSADIVVAQAATATTVTVHPHALTASVVASAPGSGTPDGTVAFSVDGNPVGSAPVVSGTATLSHTTPAGATHSISAVYSGSANYLPSSDSTARHDPSITAHLTSAHGKSAAGWYRTPVHVSFTCTPHGAPLTAACPSAVTVTHQGAARVVSRTILATDGGAATASVSINLDRTAPKVVVKGVINGGQYAKPGPTPACVASDALSGVASCTVSRHSHTTGDSTTVHYRVTARDKAGNVRTVNGTYRLVPLALAGAVFEHGAYTVHRRHTYLLEVHSVSRPAYYDATPYPGTPFQPDPIAMHAAGHHLWSLPVTMQPRLHTHRFWNIGIKIGGSMRVLKLRVLG
ncbi:MAG: Ig-like domain repeat protein, partial [Streptomyces sp.]|uniref:beta strand repeat-containing protein n=1 Tax=Streptomyces sp. TaxID=1931 RepID=UPI0025CF7C0A